MEGAQFTPAETLALESLIQTGCIRETAKSLGKSPNTISTQVQRAARRMGVGGKGGRTTVKLVVFYLRKKYGLPEGV